MAAHSTASSGVVVAGGEAARFGAVLGGGLDDGGAMVDGWLDLSALSGLRDDLISSFLWDERAAAAEDVGGSSLSQSEFEFGREPADVLIATEKA